MSSVLGYGWLHNIDLSETDTLDLVTAMMDWVQKLQKVKLGDVSLDIEELTKYPGQGRCRELHWVVTRGEDQEVGGNQGVDSHQGQCFCACDEEMKAIVINRMS